jgi:hypothetical protein
MIFCTNSDKKNKQQKKGGIREFNILSNCTVNLCDSKSYPARDILIMFYIEQNTITLNHLNGCDGNFIPVTQSAYILKLLV